MSTKRTRRVTIESDEEFAVADDGGEQRPTRSKRARRTAAADPQEAGDCAMREHDNVSARDDELDDDHTRLVEEQLYQERRRKKLPGIAAEAGVIDSVELVNFMCHKFLKVHLGPKINFVIGHNGSGKSAILTAITVCLGGKANVTNRASNIKTLIREGASCGQVTVRLRNAGDDGFRQAVYGDVITIERRLSRDGASGYKIKSNDGKIVSTKRDELTAILDHMAIQVDNPLSVLSQDAARQFLHTSSPDVKYAFFMKGTHLTQLSEDYELIRESIERTDSIIKKKKEVLPELHKEAKDAESKYKDMQKARELELTLGSLKNEMAWAQVVEVEKEVAIAEQKLEKAKRRVPAIEARQQEAETNFAQVEERIGNLEREMHTQAAASQPRQNRKRELANQIRDKKREIQDIQAQKKDINDMIKDLKQTIEERKIQIEEETRKLQGNSRQRHEEQLALFTEKNSELEELRGQLENAIKEQTESRDAYQYAEQQRRLVQENLERTRTDIRRQQEILDQLAEQKEDRLKIYGPSTPNILRDIAQETRWNHRPVGPLGLHIKLLQPEWAKTLEAVIGRRLCAFAVQTHFDRRLLTEIARRHRCNLEIIVSPDDPFDYSDGEPAPNLLTILRVLSINNEYVKRVLINCSNIESQILVHRRADADRIMYNNGRGFPHNVSACYTVDGFKVGHRGGGYATQALSTPHGTTHFITNIEEEIREAVRNQNQCKEMFKRYQQELKKASDHVQEFSTKGSSLQAGIRTLRDKEVQLHKEVMQMQDELKEEDSVNIAALTDDKEESEANVRMYMGQFAELADQVHRRNNEIQPLNAEMEQLTRELSEIADAMNLMKERFEAAVSERLEAQSAIDHWKRKLDGEQSKVNAAQEDLDMKRNNLQNFEKLASEYCSERVEVTKSAHTLDQEIKQIEARLKAREQEHGASVEEIAASLAAKKNAYTRAKQDVGNMERFSKELRFALDSRMRKWHNFRTFIALRAKIDFTWQLSKRGYDGKLIFEHENKKLHLRVQIEDQMGKASDKDPKSLSGGEKSFSTICFLLSLWSAFSCPIRCLDEFDVFMDAVNRRISMAMMIESAREADCTQCILITPQDASSMSPGPDVRVHRLQDPERGQSILRVSQD